MILTEMNHDARIVRLNGEHRQASAASCLVTPLAIGKAKP